MKSGGQKYRDLMVVDAVLSEPVSADFPVKQGKYREFCQTRQLSRIRMPNKSLVFGKELLNSLQRETRRYFERIEKLITGAGLLSPPISTRTDR